MECEQNKNLMLQNVEEFIICGIRFIFRKECFPGDLSLILYPIHNQSRL